MGGQRMKSFSLDPNWKEDGKTGLKVAGCMLIFVPVLFVFLLLVGGCLIR